MCKFCSKEINLLAKTNVPELRHGPNNKYKTFGGMSLMCELFNDSEAHKSYLESSFMLGSITGCDFSGAKDYVLEPARIEISFCPVCGKKLNE